MLEVSPEPFAGRTAPELTSKSRGSSAFADEPPESLAAVTGQTSHEDDLPTAGRPYPRALSLSVAGTSRGRVSRQIGHSRPSFTLDIYAKEFEEAGHADTAKMDEAFGWIL
jgi:hypothetical protein